MLAAVDQEVLSTRRPCLAGFNITLVCSISLLALSSFNYGISDQAFASTQATNAFAKQFGDFEQKSKVYVIPPLYLSLLNSLKAGSQLLGEFKLFGENNSPHSCYVLKLAMGSTAQYSSEKYKRVVTRPNELAIIFSPPTG